LKINSRLNLNLGVRREYDSYPTDEHGLLSKVFPAELNTVPLPEAAPSTGTVAIFAVPGRYVGYSQRVFQTITGGLWQFNAPDSARGLPI
jgi:hypothetical protein